MAGAGIFFTYLSGAWAGMSRLNCDCGPECLHEASPSGLGFLTTWQPQSSRTSYTAAQGFKSECFINQSRCCMAFYIPALEVTWHHFEWTLWMEAITGLPRCKWRGHRTQLWVAGISKNLWSYFYRQVTFSLRLPLVFVLYCRITNGHKVACNNTHLSSYSFCESGIWAWLDFRVSHERQQGVGWAVVISRFNWRRIHFQAHMDVGRI